MIKQMIARSPKKDELEGSLSTAQVRDLADGGMGSIRFVHPDDRDRRFGFEVAKADYVDRDGVSVIVGISVDQFGDLFELEFWKVNFEELETYPTPTDLKIDFKPSA